MHAKLRSCRHLQAALAAPTSHLQLRSPHLHADVHVGDGRVNSGPSRAALIALLPWRALQVGRVREQLRPRAGSAAEGSCLAVLPGRPAGQAPVPACPVQPTQGSSKLTRQSCTYFSSKGLRLCRLRSMSWSVCSRAAGCRCVAMGGAAISRLALHPLPQAWDLA